MSASHNFTNQQISELLDNMAAAYIVKNVDRFRIMAYEKAAAEIAASALDVANLWKEGKLDSIPGIGKQMTAYLDELFKTGKVKHFNNVFKDLPPAMFTFMKVPGIGPKNAYKLCLNLKITSASGALEKLKQAAESGKISQIEGFGEKSSQEILQGLGEMSRRTKRILLPQALRIGEEVLVYLKKHPAVAKGDMLGSLRRKKATIGDIDLAVVSSKPEEVIKWFTAYPKKLRVLEAGPTKASLIVAQEKQVDLRVVEEKEYGSLLQHFTGSKEHNIHLREVAIGKGMSLSEYGIKKLKAQSSKVKTIAQNSKLMTFADEREFYNFLGMEWIPPELREDRGEIELALKHKLPKLVEAKDIKGDLHLHSDFAIETSHDLGVNTMKEIVVKAQSLNYEYICFSEHNPSTSKHNDEQIISIIKRKKEVIDKLNYSEKNNRIKRTNKVFIFNGLEIDIKPDGKRAIPDKALDLLDFAIVSVHSSFRMPKAEMTKRILTALDHPKVKILGHPTGRLLNRREGYDLDWEQIFDFCQKKQKIIEINAYPDRLDLPDELVVEAIKRGIKLVINTDAHLVEQMDFMLYGVFNARRGWAKASDIVNILGYNEIKKLLMDNG
jgi:DNA polymerase (family 10)